MMTAEDVRIVVTCITQALVDDESAVTVTSTLSGRSLNVVVETAASDTGKLIGKGGRTARAVRTLISALGAKSGLIITLDILNPTR